MGVANPTQIKDPVPVNTAARIDIDVFSDRNLTTRKDITGKTVTVWILDPSVDWDMYTATHDVELTGDCHITLTAGNHATVGDAELRVEVDGELCYPRYTMTFIAEAV